MKNLIHENCPKTKAAVINGEFIMGCNECLNSTKHSAYYAASYTRRQSQVNNRKDIVQRYDGDKLNPEWVKLYESKARQEFGDNKVEELLRK